MTVAALLVASALLGAFALWRRRCLSLVAQAGHELRGPLQAALLGLHGLGGPGDGARLAAIDLELRRAARAVEDLSAAASGRRAADSVAEVELGVLLEDAGAAWELLAAHRGVGFAVEPPARPLVVRADRLRIAQALANLVANAVEHGGGEVRVCVREIAGSARIEVTDGGPGLPAPLAELVAAARGRRDRRGHGLALAAGIARRHGGRLITAPSPRGARLVLELPLAGAGEADRRSGRLALPRLAHGPRPYTRDLRPHADGLGLPDHGPRSYTRGLRPSAHGPWAYPHGLRPPAHGPWPSAHGSRPHRHWLLRLAAGWLGRRPLKALPARAREQAPGAARRA